MFNTQLKSDLQPLATEKFDENLSQIMPDSMEAATDSANFLWQINEVQRT